MHALEQSLSTADWSYLMGATWSEDLQQMLADPTLRQAVRRLLSDRRAATREGPGACVEGQSARTDEDGSYDPTEMDRTYAKARAQMTVKNGVATLRTPGATAAFIQIISDEVAFRSITDSIPLPPLGVPMDMHANGCVLTFFHGPGGTPLSDEYCEFVPLCCSEALDFTTGTQTCYDFESCRGKGLPEPPVVEPGPAESQCGSGGGVVQPVGRCGDLITDSGDQRAMACSHLDYPPGGCSGVVQVNDELDYRCGVEQKRNRCMRYKLNERPADARPAPFVPTLGDGSEAFSFWCVP